MKERTLGRTGIKVSAVGLGTARLALPERERTVKDPQDDIERLRILEEAFTLGCTHFDTADGYGFGSSEALIGQFLKNNYSSPLIVTTKIGWNFYNIFVDDQKKHYIKEKVNLDLDLALKGSTLAFDHGQNFSYDYLNFAIDKSIFRLQKNPLDIVLLHVPSVEDLQFSNWDSSMKKIRKSGKLLYYGVSVRTPIEVFAALQYGEPDIIQIPLSVMPSNPMQAALMIARQRGVGIIAREIFFQGLLIKHFQKEFNAKRVNFPPTIAIKNILNMMVNSEIVDSIVLGCSNLEQLKFNFTNLLPDAETPPIQEVIVAETLRFLRAYPCATHFLSHPDPYRDINLFCQSVKTSFL